MIEFMDVVLATAEKIKAEGLEYKYHGVPVIEGVEGFKFDILFYEYILVESGDDLDVGFRYTPNNGDLLHYQVSNSLIGSILSTYGLGDVFDEVKLREDFIYFRIGRVLTYKVLDLEAVSDKIVSIMDDFYHSHQEELFDIQPL